MFSEKVEAAYAFACEAIFVVDDAGGELLQGRFAVWMLGVARKFVVGFDSAYSDHTMLKYGNDEICTRSR